VRTAPEQSELLTAEKQFIINFLQFPKNDDEKRLPLWNWRINNNREKPRLNEFTNGKPQAMSYRCYTITLEEDQNGGGKKLNSYIPNKG